MEWSNRDPVVDWCFTEGFDFVEPFFDQTITRSLGEPFRLLFRRQTSMQELAGLSVSRPGLTPSGLVFHSSRCGSTLVTQMLARLPSVLVMAEPGPLDSVLTARSVDPSISEEQQQNWLQWMVSALGQPRHDNQERFVIKFDAWAVLHLPLIRSAFPATPAIFLYRDPIEILVSQLGHRGYHMIPGTLPPELLGLQPDEPATLSPEAYLCLVLARLLQSVLSAEERNRPELVHYRELPAAVVETIAPLFGIAIGPEDAARLAEVTTRDAKNPYLAWADDTSDKRSRATERLRRQVDELVQPVYDSLESRRRFVP